MIDFLLKTLSGRMLCVLTSQESQLGTCIFPTGPVVHRLGAELGFSGDMALLSLEGKELAFVK